MNPAGPADRRAILRLLAAAGGLLFTADKALARPAQRARIGILYWGPREFAWKYTRPGLLEGLREAGFDEGSSVDLEWRFSDGDAARDARLARELVAAGCIVILTAGNERANTLLAASPRVAVVAQVRAPVESGFASSLERPGGRVTGLASTGEGQSSKQVEVMRVLYPRMKLVSILIGTEDRDPRVRGEGFEKGVRDASMPHELRVVKGIGGFTEAFRDIRARDGVAYVVSYGQSVDARELARAAIAAGVPTMTIHKAFVDSGGLMGYYPSPLEWGRRMAAQAARIVRGTPPGDLPFEFLTRYELSLNRTTASALGIDIPRQILLQATEVISS